MAMLDFNNEAEQKNTNYGPVPAGSKVIVSITIETPKYAVEGEPLVSQAKSGLRGLWCKFTVVGGAYDDVRRTNTGPSSPGRNSSRTGL